MNQQHSPAHRPPPPDCGWETLAGEPTAVRVVLPPDASDVCIHCGRSPGSDAEALYDARHEAWVWLIDFLVEAGNGDPLTVGERTMLFQSVLHPNGETQRSLAARIGKSPAFVSEALAILRERVKHPKPIANKGFPRARVRKL